MRLLTSCLFGLFILAYPVAAQQNSQTASADCTFDDGKQITLEYHPSKGEELRNGKLWEPGGSAMILFSPTALNLGGKTIEAGAYTVYTIPDKKQWTLIVNKDVTPGSKYNSSQDIAHAPMDTGEIDQPVKELQVSFAHMAPKLCSLRMYIGKMGAFADIKEQ